jgi:hypothetical protein
MIFGKKSDLKSHLSTKKPTWAHKVVVHNAHEQHPTMERHEESPPQKNPELDEEQSEPIRSRY